MDLSLRHALAVAVSLIVLLPSAADAAPAGSTLLVSRPDGFAPLLPAFDSNSSTGAVSADGRYVVFSSGADGFAPGVNPRVVNLFVRDTRAGTTTLVSRSDGLEGAGADAEATDPDIAVTADGRVLVAFESRATNLIDHVTGPVAPGDRTQVWLRDVTRGTTTLVSRAGRDGPPANATAEDPAVGVTAGGPVVAFSSFADNLGSTGRQGVFLRTVDAATTALVSCAARDCAAPRRAADADNPDIAVVPAAAGTACVPALHPTGACVLVAFDTIDTTISQHPGGPRQVVVAASTTPVAPGAPAPPPNEFTVASKNGAAFANGFAQDASLSSDGRAVAFETSATNLTADQLPAGVPQGYVRRLDTGAVELVTRAAAVSDSRARALVLGGDAGRLRVLFSATARNLGAPAGREEVYVRDLATSTTSLLNREPGAGGQPRGVGSGSPAISADGSTAAFTTSRDALAGERFGRVRVRRLGSPGQEVEVVSRPDGDGPIESGTDTSTIRGSALSDDGRFVAFGSDTDSFSADDDDRFANVFVRDLLTGRTVLVSRASGAGGPAASADSSVAGISADGRRVVFFSAADNLSADGGGVVQSYVRDLDANTTTLVSRSTDGRAAEGAAPASDISADGNSVVFSSRSALDPAANDGQAHVYVRDLSAGTTTLADRDSGAAGTIPNVSSSNAVLDASGDRVAWVTPAPHAGAPADGVRRVFVRDLRTHATTLVTRADGPDGAPAAADSAEPAISADGQVVAFSTGAQNLGITFAPGRQVFVRDVASGRTELVSDRGATLPASAFSPSLDATGDRIEYAEQETLTPEDQPVQVFVRDRSARSHELVSRADGPDGSPSDGRVSASVISRNGNCVAFSGAYTNLGDGFASADFAGVHLRVVRGECPVQPPPAADPDRAGGDPPPGGGGPAVVDPKRPSLSRLALSPSRFHVGGRRGGTTIRFTLASAARVTVRFDRLTTGHRKGRSCSTRVRRGKRCTIVRRAGAMTVNGRAGSNRRSFSGKLGKKALKPGRYRVTATPKSGRGDRTTVVVVKAPRVKRR